MYMYDARCVVTLDAGLTRRIPSLGSPRLLVQDQVLVVFDASGSTRNRTIRIVRFACIWSDAESSTGAEESLDAHASGSMQRGSNLWCTLARNAVWVKPECGVLGNSPGVLIITLAIRRSNSLHPQCASPNRDPGLRANRQNSHPASPTIIPQDTPRRRAHSKKSHLG